MKVFVVILTNKYEGIQAIERIYAAEEHAIKAVAELSSKQRDERLADHVHQQQLAIKRSAELGFFIRPFQEEPYDTYTYYAEELL